MVTLPNIARLSARPLRATHQAGLFADPIPDDLGRELRLAALLHDVGHGFMSHVSENAVKSLGWAVDLVSAAREEIDDAELAESKKPAELASHYIIRSDAFRPLAQYLSSECALGGVNKLIRNLSRAVLGLSVSEHHPFLSQLLSGPFDVDKLDYIQRDSYFCGVPDVIDVNRLLRKLRTTMQSPIDVPAALSRSLIDAPPQIVVTGVAESGARTLDEFALARSLLTDKVYRHQKTRAQEALVGSVIEILSELSTRPISIMWCLTDSEFVSLSAAELSERLELQVGTASERRRFKLAVALRDRFVARRDFVAAYAWSADGGRDDPLDVDQQTSGIEQLREDARRAHSRQQLVNEITKTVRAMYVSLGDDPPLVKSGADLSYLIKIDQSDDPSRHRGRALLARAFLVRDNGDVTLFADEYPGTEDWSDLYLVNRDFSAVFCPREFAPIVHLACEATLLRKYGLVTTKTMAQSAHVDSEDVSGLRKRLTAARYYDGTVAVLRPEPLVLRSAATPGRLEAISTALGEFNSGLSVRFGFAANERLGKISTSVLKDFLRQLGSDSAIESMIRVLERVQLYGRDRLVAAALDGLAAAEVEPDSVVLTTLGEPNESSGAVTYLVKDTLEAQGAEFVRIDKLGESDRTNVVLLDDFIGLGSRTIGIVKGWMGTGSDAKPIPASAQDRLRSGPVHCIYATGLPGAADNVVNELEALRVAPTVYVADDSPPTLDSVPGVSTQFRTSLVVLGADLLRRNKGYTTRRARDQALGYGGHGLLVCFPWGAPKQALTPLWLSGRRADGYWRALFPRRD